MRQIKSLKYRTMSDILSARLEFAGMRFDLGGIAAFAAGLLFASLLSGCTSTGTHIPPSPGQKVENLGCMAATILDQRCQVGIEGDQDRCLYAKVIVRVCHAAAPTAEQGLVAGLVSSPLTSPGSGYNPRSTSTFWRDIPGGPEVRGTGDLSADPWALACAAKTGPDLAACLRSRFLESSPAVCAEYRKAFGTQTCGTPAGGWTRGPSNERWGAAVQALNYFCENDPAFIGSTGRAGGWDCESTAVEWARLGAFAGEAIVTEWQKRTAGPPAPRCGDRRVDPGETCANCPQDLGACPPPPPPPPAPNDGKVDCAVLTLPSPGSPLYVGFRAGTDSTGSVGVSLVECRVGGALPAPRPVLSPASRAVLAAVCGWIPKSSTARRRQCAGAVAELFGLDLLNAQASAEGRP